MANAKISDLTAYTTPIATDVLPIVDVTAAATKKIAVPNLLIDSTVTSRKVQLQYASGAHSGGTQAQLTSGSTWYDLTNVTFTVTPAVASVLVVCITGSFFSDTVNGRVDVRIYDNSTSTQLGASTIYSATANQRCQVAIYAIVTLTAASHVIKCQMADLAAGNHTISEDGDSAIVSGFYFSQ